jgi:phosphotransacetylase
MMVKVGDADALITGVAQPILHSRPMMEIIEWHQEWRKLPQQT